MSILALDTALDACSVALLTAGGDVLARATRDIGRGHAEVLMAVAGEVFEAAGVSPEERPEQLGLEAWVRLTDAAAAAGVSV